jgi:hypothetical protein
MAKFIFSFAQFLLLCYYMILLVGLVQNSLDESGVFPCRYHSTIVLHAYATWGMNGRPVGGRSLES